MGLKWMEHKGKRILYLDFRGIDGEPAIQQLDELAAEIDRTPGEILIMINFEGTRATTRFMSHAKQIGKSKVEPRDIRSAAVGITGIKEVLLEGYNKFTGRSLRNFKTEAQALEWLVSEEGR